MVGDFKYIYNNNMYYGAKRTAEFSRFVLGVGFFFVFSQFICKYSFARDLRRARKINFECKKMKAKSWIKHKNLYEKRILFE